MTPEQVRYARILAKRKHIRYVFESMSVDNTVTETQLKLKLKLEN